MTSESRTSDSISFSYSAALSISSPDWPIFSSCKAILCFPTVLALTPRSLLWPCPRLWGVVKRRHMAWVSAAFGTGQATATHWDCCVSQCAWCELSLRVCSTWCLCSTLLGALTAVLQSKESHSKPVLSQWCFCAKAAQGLEKTCARVARGDKE